MIKRKKSLQSSFPEQQEYWSCIATKKIFNFPFYLNLFKQYSKKSYKVLDYGCGYGRILGHLVKEGFMHLYGIDFADEMLKLTYKNCPTVNVSQNDSLYIPYDNNQFDTVIVCAVLGCNPNAQDQKLIINEISRVLKPRGVLYLADFLINDDKRNIMRYKSFPTSINFEYGVFELKSGVLIRHHTESYIRKLLSVYEEKVFLKSVVKTMNGHQANGFTYIGINNK